MVKPFENPPFTYMAMVNARTSKMIAKIMAITELLAIDIWIGY